MTLVSEGALLVVAAQAGFLDGPRVLANMAVDSWVPRRFAALSERLTTQNGILLMGVASLRRCLHAAATSAQLVVMYSINVFLTFSLSMLGMAQSCRAARQRRRTGSGDSRCSSSGFVLCATILVVTVFEKFVEGGWITLRRRPGSWSRSASLIRRHYRAVDATLAKLYAELENLPLGPAGRRAGALDPTQPTAAVLVGGLRRRSASTRC